MNAEIISVGTELLLGQTINTDAAIVAQALSGLGINLLYTSVVGDNPERLKGSIELSAKRSDIVVMTGGLGPTEDDLTKETAAEVAGLELVLHEESLNRIANYFSDSRVNATQKKQAMLPKGSIVFQNDNGTAPGCAFKTKFGSEIIMLPGPPSELKPMLLERVVPYLKNLTGSEIIASHNVNIYGKGEAAAALDISDLLQSQNPTVAPYAKDGEMFFRVTAKASSQAAADAITLPVVEEIRNRLGDVVYGIDAGSLEKLAVNLLEQSGKTIATAESCTGGLLAKRITDIPGSSQVFEMGCVTYSNKVKEQLLAVDHDILRQHGAVSPETAAAMAIGIHQLSKSDIGIGITGIAGPDGGSAEKPIGLVYIALTDGKNSYVAKRLPVGRTKSRDWHRHCAASQALDMVRRYLTGLPVISGQWWAQV